jgi:hypothetical protein
MASTGKILILGATTAIAMLILAKVEVTSDARDHTVSQQISSPEQPAAFRKTNVIYGANASISTYGLDPARTTDW